MYYDSASSGEASRDTVSTAYSFDDPWGDDADAAQRFSMYATYTAGGGADKRVMVVS